tara:strand:+ start:350 stop:532 length:183 start_codon:yes stop_codon:yes gene_type:complete
MAVEVVPSALQVCPVAREADPFASVVNPSDVAKKLVAFVEFPNAVEYTPLDSLPPDAKLF